MLILKSAFCYCLVDYIAFKLLTLMDFLGFVSRFPVGITLIVCDELFTRS